MVVTARKDDFMIVIIVIQARQVHHDLFNTYTTLKFSLHYDQSHVILHYEISLKPFFPSPS